MNDPVTPDLESKFGFAPGEESKVDQDADIDFHNIQVKEEAKTDNETPGQHVIEDLELDEDDIAGAIDDDEEQIQTTNVSIKQDIKQETSDSHVPVKIEQAATETYEQLQEKYKKLKEESGGRMTDQMAKLRIEHLKKIRESKIQKRWLNAMVHFGVEPKEYLENRENIYKQFYPFSDFNLIKAKQGEYQRKKMAFLVIEVLKFEVINDTYNVEGKVSLLHFSLKSNYFIGCHRANNARNFPYEL